MFGIWLIIKIRLFPRDEIILLVDHRLWTAWFRSYVMISSMSSSAISSIDFSPEIIGPVSMSMMSFILLDKTELLETLMTGTIGFPVGVPIPW